MIKGNNKVGILILLLVLPAFIFIGLYLFGDNEFTLEEISNEELKIYNPRVVNCEFNDKDGVHRIPSFEFLNQDSVLVSLDNYKNKIFVVDYFFTRCPGICIEMSSQLRRVQEALERFDDVKILSHSVDPEYDRPYRLKNYAESYGANPAIWTFVTGEKSEIYEQARCGYFIVAKPNEEDPLDFIHSDKLVLIDKEKRIRGYYSGTEREDVDRLITEILILREEYN